MGDFTKDGVTNGADYALWRKTQGHHVPNYSGADGDGDGVIGLGDVNVWRAHFGQTLPAPGNVVGGATASAALDPAVDQSMGAGASIAVSVSDLHQFAGLQPTSGEKQAASQRDEALVAWLASQPETENQSDDHGTAEIWASPDTSDEDDFQVESVQQLFALLARS